MKITEETNSDQSKFKITIELSENDLINLEMTDEYKEFIMRKRGGKTQTSKLFGLLALIAKIEEKESINLN